MVSAERCKRVERRRTGTAGEETSDPSESGSSGGGPVQSFTSVSVQSRVDFIPPLSSPSSWSISVVVQGVISLAGSGAGKEEGPGSGGGAAKGSSVSFPTFAPVSEHSLVACCLSVMRSRLLGIIWSASRLVLAQLSSLLGNFGSATLRFEASSPITGEVLSSSITSPVEGFGIAGAVIYDQ